MILWWMTAAALASTPVEDATPLPLYLDDAQVRLAVAARAEALSACTATVADGALPLSFAVAGDGAIVDLQVEAPGLDPTCVAAALAEHGLPDHHGAPVAVHATLHVREGAARIGPVVDVDERVARGLFLLVPPDLSPETRAELLDALGVAESGSAVRAGPGEVYTPAQP
ncbi:MAG: hypothetical protein H6742_07135 [Alphaproteobacteria bacterium]|nr:hypothetical protein [Alphaproteobacteria bacterium]